MNNLKKQLKKITLVKIVEGIITKVTKTELHIFLFEEQKNAKCKLTNVTDFSWEAISSDFKEGTVHKFAISKYEEDQDFYWLNYKILHPMQIKNKRRSIPTLSHDRNLSKFLKNLLSQETKKVV